MRRHGPPLLLPRCVHRRRAGRQSARRRARRRTGSTTRGHAGASPASSTCPRRCSCRAPEPGQHGGGAHLHAGRANCRSRAIRRSGRRCCWRICAPAICWRAQDLRIVLEEKIGEVVCVARHRRGEAMAAYFTLPRLPASAGARRVADDSPPSSGLKSPTSGSARIDPTRVRRRRARTFSCRLRRSTRWRGRGRDKTAWGADGGPVRVSLYPEVARTGSQLSRAHVRRRLGHRRRPGDRQRRGRLRGCRHGVRRARRRRAHARHRARIRDGAAEPHLARARVEAGALRSATIGGSAVIVSEGSCGL